MKCRLCPRACGADREKTAGFCGADNRIKVGRIGLHSFEEPVISGSRGSGAVFFAGCNLKCCFCQNAAVSVGGGGKVLTLPQLKDAVADLAARGAHNINLVTAGHYLPYIAGALTEVKAEIGLPFVYNSGGYELTDALELINNVVDVYLPDFKYADSALADRYSGAPDYPPIAARAIEYMYRNKGVPVVEDGLIRHGLIVRHLVLPGCRKDSIAVVRYIADRYPGAYISLMRQYTPAFNRGPHELDRKVTSFEYESVLREAIRLGLKGYYQQPGCESAAFTPSFTL